MSWRRPWGVRWECRRYKHKPCSISETSEGPFYCERCGKWLGWRWTVIC